MSKNSSSKAKSTAVSKKQARQEARKFRKTLSASDLEERSQQIMKRAEKFLQELNLNDNHVHMYRPIRKLKEIDTTRLVKVLSQGHTVTIQSQTPFFPEGRFDVVFVPGLAFDMNGNRVGYGLGAYDSFLVTQEQAIKIGVQYDEQVLEAIEMEDHDQQLNYIITEKRIIRLS